ncbi:AraC family transcriptional regulator [Chitinophaga ginsengisegetis]|uniref:helix-turn-helix domain-containing protein n=1 Tax=Chitinophaga ginsengisegetis TaxID=393003 RepID=UPI003415C51E
MFHLTGIIISLFLALLLFTKKGKSTADFILALWLTLIALHLFCYYTLVSGTYVEFPYLLGVEIPLPLIHGPFLYLYIAALVNQSNKRLHWFIHFIPATIAYLLLSGFFIQTFNHKINVYQHHGIGYEKLVSIIRLPIIPSGIIYVVWSLILLKKHSINIQKQFSYTEKINLNWLVYLTIGMGAIWLSVILGNDISTFMLVDLFILFIGYFGIKQVGIFTNRVVNTQLMGTDSIKLEEGNDPGVSSLANGTEKTKYLKTAVEPELMSKVHKELTLLMQTEKLFKDPGLNLDGLAGRLGVHSNTLSQVINSMEQRNFYDYINDFRIKEFQRIAVLPENSNFTLLSLAFEVGFNSKTSFNRNFKKATGLSPKEYCQQEKIQLGNAT